MQGFRPAGAKFRLNFVQPIPEFRLSFVQGFRPAGAKFRLNFVQPVSEFRLSFVQGFRPAASEFRLNFVQAVSNFRLGFVQRVCRQSVSSRAILSNLRQSTHILCPIFGQISKSL